MQLWWQAKSAHPRISRSDSLVVLGKPTCFAISGQCVVLDYSCRDGNQMCNPSCASIFMYHFPPAICCVAVSRIIAGYEPPEEITKCGKRKCSVGKLKGRAEEARKAEMYDEMGADLLRALSKKIDQEQVTTRLHRDLERAFDGIGRQRQREEEERLEQEKIDKRRADGEAAMEESRLRKLKDEEDWAAFESGDAAITEAGAAAADGTADAAAEVLAAVTLTMTHTKGDGEKTETPVTAELFEGQDAAHAAYDLCESVGLHNADEVTKIAGLLKAKAGESYAVPAPTATTEKLFVLARKESKAANFAAAGAAWSTALHGGADGVAAITDEMKAEAEGAMVDAMQMQRKVAAFEAIYMTHEW